jgi:DNA adenine methylase
MQLDIEIFKNQFNSFPGTRYMGSKNKIIIEIWNHLKDYEFNSVLDCFAGSNVVGYFLKCQGKRVITNDFLAFSYINSKATIENSTEIITQDDILFLLSENKNPGFIKKTFREIFFTDEENAFLDKVRYNILAIKNEYKEALALSALVRACLKKRARGVFTYAGERYDDGRLDMKKSIETHFMESIQILNNSVFDNKEHNEAHNKRSEEFYYKTDLVYFDPPYFTPNSDNDYVRRYHFIEGLVKNWEGIEIQQKSKVKKFESYRSPFSKKESAYTAFDELFKKYIDSIIAISYSSNSYPNKEELFEMLSHYKKNVQVFEIDHTYSFGNQNHKIGNLNNRVKEYLFIGT